MCRLCAVLLDLLSLAIGRRKPAALLLGVLRRGVLVLGLRLGGSARRCRLLLGVRLGGGVWPEALLLALVLRGRARPGSLLLDVGGRWAPLEGDGGGFRDIAAESLAESCCIISIDAGIVTSA